MLTNPGTLPAIRDLLRATHYHQARDRQPGSRYVSAGHELVELVTAGRGWIRHEDQEQEVTAGALVWHIAGDQTICRSDPTSPYRCLAADFLLCETVAAPQRRLPRLTWWPDPEAVRRFTHEIVRRFADESVDREALSDHCAATLHLRGKLWLSRPVDDLPPGLRRVVDHIDQHYHGDSSLLDLATLAGCSVPHLHALFKRHLGSTPHRQLIDRRLRAAREALLGGDDPVTRIARSCGFSSAAAFCRSFKQQVGETPEGYRRSNAGRL